jgi:hypothetical protein
MANLKNLFDTFSRRTPPPSGGSYPKVPQTTRIRVLRWCVELYRGERPSEIIGRGDYNLQFWEEMQRRILYRTGRPSLTQAGNDPTAVPNAYLLACSESEFLDFLEDIFNNDTFFQVNMGDKNIVDELNTILRVDNLPYAITHFVTEKVVHTSGMYTGHTGTQIGSYPQVILRESEVLHQDAISPALELLSQPHFASANKEFLAALEDYRKGEIGDCLVKCGSALESVMKVICDRKHWPYKQTDTAGPLIKVIIANTSLDTYLEPLLIGVATIRNKMSTAHGAGTTVKQPARHIAQYTLNMTASAMLMLTQEAGV